MVVLLVFTCPTVSGRRRLPIRMKITDVEHRVVDIDATRAHAYNQVNVRRLRSGDLVAVYNEERFPYHHDSGQTVMQCFQAVVKRRGSVGMPMQWRWLRSQ